MNNFEDLKTTGLMVNYYHICHRKVWLFKNKISFEANSDRVILGKLLHENSYREYEKREVLFDQLLKIDILSRGQVHEIKLSDRMHQATLMQLAYYLYYLKQFGINKRGTINYPLQKKVIDIELTPQLEKQVKDSLEEIKNIINLQKPPPPEKKDYCKSCAYFEFCFVE